MIRHVDNELFIESINQDFKDIRNKMAAKTLDNMVYDYKKSMDEKTM